MNGPRQFVCSVCKSKWTEDSGFHDPYSCPNCKSDNIYRKEDQSEYKSFLSNQRGRFRD